MVTGKFPVRRFLGTQHVLEQGGLRNVCWPLGLGNPADGLTKVKSDVATLLRLPESGTLNPDTLRPLRGVSSSQRAD